MAIPLTPDAPPAAEGPSSFLMALVIGAILVAAAIGYFGLTGSLGGGIPGTYPGHGGAGPPPAASCEGHDAAGHVFFSFVAGATAENQGYNFNGSSPGPCVLVTQGANVTVNFSVGHQAGMNHSWVLIRSGASATSPPAFPGAGFTGPSASVGIAPGAFEVFHFVASSAGSYQYICEMPGHFTLGMWGWFNVTAPG